MNIKLKKLVVSLLAMVTLVACGPKGSTEMVKETTEIEFATREELTDTLYEGVKTVKIEGVKGSKETTYRVVYDGKGKEVSKDFESEVIVLEPVDEVVLVGTKKLEGKTLETKEITESEVIKFASKEEKDSSILLGETKVKQEGKDGLKEIVYTITLLDGVEQGREKISEKVVVEAKDKIVLVGTKTNPNSKTTTKEVKVNETIKFTTKEVKTDTLYVGERKVQTSGVNGTKEVTYKVTYVDGKETKRDYVSEKITKQPVAEVVNVGTKSKPANQNTTTKRITEQQTVAFKTVESNSDQYEVGTVKRTEGQNGINEVTIEITMVNGKEVSRKVISTKTIKAPVNATIINGTKPKPAAQPVVDYNKGRELGRLISEYKASLGITTVWNEQLYEESALVRVKEQLQRQGHIRPDGSSPATVVKPGSKWMFAGEILAATSNPNTAMQNFLGSSAHKAVLQDPYTNIVAAAYISNPSSSIGSGFFVVIFGENH